MRDLRPIRRWADVVRLVRAAATGVVVIEYLASPPLWVACLAMLFVAGVVWVAIGYRR